MNETAPDGIELWEVSKDPGPTSFWRRVKLAVSLIRGHGVVHGAKFGVSDGQLWLIQRKDQAPTTVCQAIVYNADTYQERLMISGPDWVKIEKDQHGRNARRHRSK